jgi:hypothetical protein
MNVHIIVKQMGRTNPKNQAKVIILGKMVDRDTKLKVLQTSTHSTTQYGYKFNITQTS